MSQDVVPVTSKVTELFSRSRFGDTSFDMGFVRVLVVDYATGQDMEDEEQMKEVERCAMQE